MMVAYQASPSERLNAAGARRSLIETMAVRSILIASVCMLIGSASSVAQSLRLPGGMQWKSGDVTLRVEFYAPGVVRVLRWTSAEAPARPSLVVVQKPATDLKVDVRENSQTIALASEALEVVVAKPDGSIEYRAAGSGPVLKESGLAVITPTEVPNERAYSVMQRFALGPDEGIYGLGQHQHGFMNLRGHTVKLVQTNTDAVTPFLISTRNYGIYWDNTSKTVFEDNGKGASLWSEVADCMDYYFILGKNMDGVIAGYRNLTGQAPLYGKWAYGYWQSKEHYENPDELLHVAREYRRRGIPIDNIVQDWDYWDGGENWSQLFFDEKKFPHAKEMIDSIHGLHMHIMISIWPGLGPNTPVYKEMQRNGYLYNTVGWGGFKYYDAYNPAANDIYWRYMNKGLFAQGIDAWWMDSTEPDIVNAQTKESSEYELKKTGRNFLGSFARYLNPYSLVVTEPVYRHQRKVTDRKRVYILTRSTFAGQQRAAATTWSGDIGASWQIYKDQIPAGLNHCMSGIPYWTFDIGAFVIGSYGGVFSRGGKDPAYQELYTRMFQFGSFCPIFRSHGSETPREIWEFGEFTPSLVKFDNLRYRLMPYIYSLGHQVTSDGYTIMRGLPMDFPDDRRTYSIGDQFMFGPGIMVCPVTEYMYKRPPEPSVLIPASAFRTIDGRKGLEAKYYRDAQFKDSSFARVDSTIDILWYTGRPAFVTDSTLSIRWEGKLVPMQTGKHQFHIKCYGPRRIFLDGKELPFVYRSVEAYTDLVDLQAGKEYRLRVEAENTSTGAMKAILNWKTPDILDREKMPEQKEKRRGVYLPAGRRWYDFWTGEQVAGGQTIAADAPIDKIPLFVPGGSIVPMGPFVQYAAEKPADPLELRIYAGADAAFTLYEDENDNYDYEKGVYSTITFRWNDAGRRLTITRREGSFPGMIEKRSFHVVVVKGDSRNGLEIAGKPDRIVQYSGEELKADF